MNGFGFFVRLFMKAQATPDISLVEVAVYPMIEKMNNRILCLLFQRRRGCGEVDCLCVNIV